MSPRTCYEHRGPLPCPACNARMVPPPEGLIEEIRAHLAEVAAKNAKKETRHQTAGPR